MSNSKKLKYKLFYNKMLSSNYLYGAEIKFSQKNITYKNIYLPSGKTITKWSSKIDYMQNTIPANLPVLFPNKTYKIILNFTTRPAKTAMIKINYFDYLDQLIHSEFYYNNAKIKCPSNLSYYTVELVCAGFNEINFNCIEINEL